MSFQVCSSRTSSPTNKIFPEGTTYTGSNPSKFDGLPEKVQDLARDLGTETLKVDSLNREIDQLTKEVKKLKMNLDTQGLALGRRIDELTNKCNLLERKIATVDSQQSLDVVMLTSRTVRNRSYSSARDATPTRNPNPQNPHSPRSLATSRMGALKSEETETSVFNDPGLNGEVFSNLGKEGEKKKG